MKSSEKGMNIEKISLKFKNMINKGNVKGALKLLTESMSNGMLPLNDKTLTMLKQKHPKANEPPQEVLLQGSTRPIHPILYENMDESLILKAAMLTKGGSGPSGLDADGWRKILTSRSFGTASSELRKTFALFVKRLCVEEIKNAESLESFIACRLTSLDKRPGLRPIGVGEVLRKIAGKVVMILLKKDVLRAAGSQQLCGGQIAGSKAAIHAMHDVFNDDNTEGILLIEAENAFDSINRKVMLHNLKLLCPVIGTYILNCYMCPAGLFVIGGGELFSNEGTTQVDPTSVGAYALAMLPLLPFLLDFIAVNELNAKEEVAFADDFTVAGKLSSIKDYWSQLTSIGPKYGYFPRASKSYFIVKEDQLPNATTLFDNSNINITVEGKRHLRAIVGSDSYKREYVDDLVKDWNSQLCMLSTVAESQPQAAYSAFVSGFKSKLSNFARTIPDISNLLIPIEDTIRNRFIPAITGGRICNEEECKLLSLPTRYGGLSVPVFHEQAEVDYNNSRRITTELTSFITVEQMEYTVDALAIKKSN